jgi:hypothetical protein
LSRFFAVDGRAFAARRMQRMFAESFANLHLSPLN